MNDEKNIFLFSLRCLHWSESFSSAGRPTPPSPLQAGSQMRQIKSNLLHLVVTVNISVLRDPGSGLLGAAPGHCASPADGQDLRPLEPDHLRLHECFGRKINQNLATN